MREPLDSRDTHVVGIGSEPSVVTVQLNGVPSGPLAVDRILREFAAARLELQSIARTASDRDVTLSLTVAADAVPTLAPLVARLIRDNIARDATVGAPAAPVAVLGARHADRLSIATRMFRALSREGINSECLTASDARIWCLVRDDDRQRALGALQEEFVEELARLKEGQIGL